MEVQTKTINGVEYNYGVYPLVSNGSDILRLITPDFDFTNPSIDPKFLAISLLETMQKHGGVGLASPQIGLSHRVFAMGAGSTGYVCFNPVIVSSSGMENFAEGCLSFKGLFLAIKRPAMVNVKYQDMNGNFHEEVFEGLTARTFQHELDHLNGVLFTTLVNPYHLDKAKSKVKSNLKKLARQAEALEKQRIVQQAMQKVIAEKKAAELSKQISIDIPDVSINV